MISVGIVFSYDAVIPMTIALTPYVADALLASLMALYASCVLVAEYRTPHTEYDEEKTVTLAYATLLKVSGNVMDELLAV